MKQRQNLFKSGFTIIEVALVLAIAGIVIMMVFIALPALQRSQRDTSRANDINRLADSIQRFQANNRGAVPKPNGNSNTDKVRGHSSKQVSNDQYKKSGTWGFFYDNYVLVGSAGQTDTFADPDGTSYSLIVKPCSSDAKKPGEECDATVQRYNVTFDEQSTGGNESLSIQSDNYLTSQDSGGNNGHAISVVTNATCSNEIAVYSTGNRKIALLYKKEGGGSICVNI